MKTLSEKKELINGKCPECTNENVFIEKDVKQAIKELEQHLPLEYYNEELKRIFGEELL